MVLIEILLNDKLNYWISMILLDIFLLWKNYFFLLYFGYIWKTSLIFLINFHVVEFLALKSLNGQLKDTFVFGRKDGFRNQKAIVIPPEFKSTLCSVKSKIFQLSHIWLIKKPLLVDVNFYYMHCKCTMFRTAQKSDTF